MLYIGNLTGGEIQYIDKRVTSEEEINQLVEEYTERYNSAYEGYWTAINELADVNERIELAKSAKYRMQQEKKEIPYYRIRISEDYQVFQQNNNHNLIEIANPNEGSAIGEQTTLETLYTYTGASFNNTDPEIYLTDDDKEMLEYLLYKSRDENGHANLSEAGNLMEQYLLAIEDKVNQRCGEFQALEVVNNLYDENGEIKADAGDLLMMALEEGFPDGVTKFFDDLSTVFDVEAVMTDTQYKQKYLLELLEGHEWLTRAYNNGQAIGYMAVPMAVSTITTIITENPDIGKKVSSFLMGLAGGSGAKNQALLEGSNALDAIKYGIVSGMSETLLEFCLGKIPGLSETENYSLKNAFLEALEEGLEEIVDFGAQAVICHEAVDITEMGADVLNAFIMGGVVYGELGAPGFVASRGAKYINVIYNGVKIKLDLSKIKAEAEARGISYAEVVSNAVNEQVVDTSDAPRCVDVDGKEFVTIDQAELDKLYTPDMVNISENVRKIFAKLVEENKQKFIDYAIQKKKNTPEVALDGYNVYMKKLTNNDTHVIKNTGWNILLDMFKDDLSEADMKLIEGEVTFETDSADKIARREAIADYFINVKQYFKNATEVAKAFTGVDHETGGICPFASLCNNLARMLSEKDFKSHFGYDKLYVDSTGTTRVNEIFLAEAFFEISKGKNYIKGENGYYTKRPGKFEVVDISNSMQVDWITINEKFLNDRGLHAEEVECKTNKVSKFSPYSEDENPDILHSARELLSAIYRAYKNNWGTMITVNGGNMYAWDGSYYQNYNNKGHSVTAIFPNSMNEISESEFVDFMLGKGVPVFSYGKAKYIRPEDVGAIYTHESGLRLTSIGYSSFKLVEKK